MRRFMSAVGLGLGSLICLVFVFIVIAASVFMNGWFAFMRMGGDVTHVDFQTISVTALSFAAVAAGIDILKAFALGWASRAWAYKKYGYVAGSSCLLIVGVCLSVLSAYGFISENRSGEKTERVAQQETVASLSTQVADSRQRISQLGFVRPAAAIEAELEAQRQQRRWDSTKGCIDATAKESREFCTAYNQLKGELAQAEALKNERAHLASLTARLDTIRAAGGVKAVDPQLENLASVSGVPAGNIDFAITALYALGIEFVTIFGLSFALGHGPKPVSRQATSPVSRPDATTRDTPRQNHTVVDVTPVAATTAKLLPKPAPDWLDEFSQYGLERLERADGAMIALRDLHADYCAWCKRGGREAMSLREITKTLERVVGEIDEIDLTTRARKKVLLNMRLRERLAA